MKRRNALAIRCTAFCFTACAVLGAHADTDFAARAKAYAALPDWRGVWEMQLGATAGVSGRFEGHADSLEAIKKNSKLLAPPPYNAAWEAKRQAALAAFARASAAEAPPPDVKVCALTFPAMMESLATFQLVTTPDETLIIFDYGSVRHIYTDGRAHPKREDLWPTAAGHSIGRWDGQTLVVDTIAHRAGPTTLIPIPGTAELSEDAHFTERLRRIDRDTFEDDMTIEDPARMTRPWRFTLRYTRLGGLDRLIAYDCEENDRNPIVDGKTTIAAPR